MYEPNSIFRVLDASLNRVHEGFRTLEEAARFVMNDALRSERVKDLRHDLAQIAQLIPRESLLRSRDTVSDVGTEIESEGEYVRQDLRSVVAAASARVQQSLRVLEEYSKVIDSSGTRFCIALPRIPFSKGTCATCWNLYVRKPDTIKNENKARSAT